MLVHGRKVPCGARVYGKIDLTDRANWTDYVTACNAVESVYYDGVGFVLGDGVVGIDLDDCRDLQTGTLTAAAQEIVDRIASYTEVSPSGTGVKIFLLASTDVNRRTDSVEVYSRDRYFTVTGQHVPGAPDDLQERTEELTALCKDLFGSTARPLRVSESRAASLESSRPRPSAWRNLRPHWHPDDEDDDVLLAKAHADPWKGAKFGDLFAGRWQAYGYETQSNADLALCSRLAYWTEGDADRMDRLFRRSGLMRAKWDERRGSSTYGARTIAVALG